MVRIGSGIYANIINREDFKKCISGGFEIKKLGVLLLMREQFNFTLKS